MTWIGKLPANQCSIWWAWIRVQPERVEWRVGTWEMDWFPVLPLVRSVMNHILAQFPSPLCRCWAACSRNTVSQLWSLPCSWSRGRTTASKGRRPVGRETPRWTRQCRRSRRRRTGRRECTGRIEVLRRQASFPYTASWLRPSSLSQRPPTRRRFKERTVERGTIKVALYDKVPDLSWKKKIRNSCRGNPLKEEQQGHRHGKVTYLFERGKITRKNCWKRDSKGHLVRWSSWPVLKEKRFGKNSKKRTTKVWRSVWRV